VNLRRLLSASALLIGLVVSPSIAAAQPSTTPPANFSAICFGATSGTAVTGTYGNLTITGNMYVPDGASLNVSGTLTVGPGACLDAFSLGTVKVGQNVQVQNGATLALGCAPGSNGPPPVAPCFFQTTNDTVGGSIIANAPLTMYLTAVNVGGNVTSNGGGSPNPAISFPVKNMTIAGNLVLQGWHGAWIGALRNHVNGSVTISNNVGSRIGDTGKPDSTEVVTNTVGGNLICENNTPPAQLGDATEDPLNGNGLNTVGGRTTGECKGLTT
jgi:hypothetical protein